MSAIIAMMITPALLERRYVALVCECERERDGCAGVASRGVGVEAQLGQVLRGVRTG